MVLFFVTAKRLNQHLLPIKPGRLAINFTCHRCRTSLIVYHKVQVVWERGLSRGAILIISSIIRRRRSLNFPPRRSRRVSLCVVVASVYIVDLLPVS